MVSFVRHGIVEPDDATRTIHESAAMLGLGLAAEMPENTVIVTGLRKTVTTNHLETTFREFGDIDEAAVASDARGFGLVRFLSPQSAVRAMNTFRESEIVVQDVAVTVKVLKSDTPNEE
jgi:RNA recognition motif-containing protein